MAENEALDVKSRYGARWRKVQHLAQSGKPTEEVGRAAKRALYGALKNSVLAEASTIQVFESGIGSLNIPLMAGMVSSMSTRSCHPRFIQDINSLVSLVTNREMRFVLPFADRTKADLVRWLKDHGLSDLVRRTISCSSYPVRFGKQRACGVCPACIFRRQAIVAADVRESGRNYKYDLFSERANRIPQTKLAFLKAFLMQASQLQSVDQDRSLPRPIKTYLLNSGISEGSVIPESVVSLLKSYRQDWITFAEHGMQKGASWPKLLLGASKQIQGVNHA